MARVPTVTEVRQIIVTGLTDGDVQAAINDAALIVEACVASLDDARAAAIVKYVAADLISSTIATRGRGPQTAKALGDASESWAGAGSGVTFGQSTYWGKALALDPNGCLRGLSMRRATIERV